MLTGSTEESVQQSAFSQQPLFEFEKQAAVQVAKASHGCFLLNLSHKKNERQKTDESQHCYQPAGPSLHDFTDSGAGWTATGHERRRNHQSEPGRLRPS